MNALVHPAIRKASEENFTYIKGPRSGKDYRFYDSMYAVLDPDRRSPLSGSGAKTFTYLQVIS
ncbi:hypothetical protein [Bacillus paranthracis]|uniref:hypothetical protein n=1 Tax=Bacillus paranthracis TaxID=2026186 RepID=UPI0039A1702E